MLIMVERNVAQQLHANVRTTDAQEVLKATSWSVRVVGDFMIVMNNLLSIPVTVRHPQQFSDSRSFVAAFKREFLHLLEALPVPRGKIGMIRDSQMASINFMSPIPAAIQQRLQVFQNLLNQPGVIHWDEDPSNAVISLQLAKSIRLQNPDTGDAQSVIDVFKQYVVNDFALPAHPKLNEHNRQYLYRSSSLNDVMNESAVTEQITTDYKKTLNRQNKSDAIIDRDLDYANDYMSYVAELGQSIIDDLTMPYYYILDYASRNDERASMTKLRGMRAAFRELARFLKGQALFSAADFDEFTQAVSQAIEDTTPTLQGFRLERMLHSAESELQRRRSLLYHARKYSNNRYQVRVELNGYHPKMWRQLAVSGETRLDDFCYLILAAFHAGGSHLYALNHGKDIYQLPYLDNGENITLHWLGEFKQGDQLTLDYDFGDSWSFKITIEKVTKRRTSLTSQEAQLLAGSGKGIIDDIGGVAGLEAAAQDDPSLNEDFDPKAEQEDWVDASRQLARRYE